MAEDFIENGQPGWVDIYQKVSEEETAIMNKCFAEYKISFLEKQNLSEKIKDQGMKIEDILNHIQSLQDRIAKLEKFVSDQTGD